MIERLQLLLKTKNLSASQLADETGIQRSIMSHVMNGRNKASLDFILRILKKYPDINPDWFLFGKGPMIRDNTLFDQEQSGELETVKKQNEQLKEQVDQLNETIQRLQAEKEEPNQQQASINQNQENICQSASQLRDEDPPFYGHKKAEINRIETIVALYEDGTFKEYNKS